MQKTPQIHHQILILITKMSNRLKLVIAAVPEQCNIPLLIGLNSPIGRYCKVLYND